MSLSLAKTLLHQGIAIHISPVWQIFFCQDGVDYDAIFDSSDLDARASRADALERTWDRIRFNYQQSLDAEGLTDVAPQVCLFKDVWQGQRCFFAVRR